MKVNAYNLKYSRANSEENGSEKNTLRLSFLSHKIIESKKKKGGDGEVGSYTKIVLCLEFDPASFVPSERASYIRDEVKVMQSFVKCKRLDFYDTQ